MQAFWSMFTKCRHWRIFPSEGLIYRGADKTLARPDWKNYLKGRHFSSDAEVIAAVETCLDGQLSELLYEWLAKVRIWSL